MQKNRLDIELVKRGIVSSRSQAESYIKLGKVYVNKHQITKPGFFVSATAYIELTQQEQYVSRAALKLASIKDKFKLDFDNKTILDVGSSTGGFTDFCLKNGAQKVIAVDVGTNQLHSSLRNNPKIELHEQTDIRDLLACGSNSFNNIDIVLMDVSFISVREILPHINKICLPSTQIVVMVKPQFESGNNFHHHGVIKNDAIRRDILRKFEIWVKKYYVIVDKADSGVAGAKGNKERFYLLKIIDKI